jgi:hypothetical protein
MSQYPYEPTIGGVTRPSNTLGLAGFICSLAGLILGLLTGGLAGILCIVGLIMSLAALGRQPRGFAVAGIIIGLLGTCVGILMIMILGFGLLALLGVAAVAFVTEAERIEITADMAVITGFVQHYEDENRRLPDSLDDLEIPQSKRLDPWGTPYDYRLTPDTKMRFDLVSAGPDLQLDTEDDMRLSRLGEAWEGAFENFDEKMKEFESRPVELQFEEEDSPDQAEPEAPPDEAEAPPPGEGS